MAFRSTSTTSSPHCRLQSNKSTWIERLLAVFMPFDCREERVHKERVLGICGARGGVTLLLSFELGSYPRLLVHLGVRP